MAINTTIDKTGYPIGAAGLVVRGIANSGEYSYTTSLPAGTYVWSVNAGINGATGTAGLNMVSNPSYPALTAGNYNYIKTANAETGSIFYVSWTTRILNTGANATGIAYGSVGGTGTYVTVGQTATNGTVATSTDLVTWTSRTYPTAQNITCVAYSTNATTQFIAGGASGSMSFSTDGVTWTAVTTPGFGTSQINAVAQNGTYALWGGTTGTANQQIRYNTLPLSAGTTSTLLTTTFGTSTVSAIAFGLVGATNTWVIGGAGGTIHYSQASPPTSTTAATSGTTNAITALAYSNAGTYKFIAGGASGTILASTDGVTWTAATAANFGTSNVTAITYNTGNSLWYAAGAGGTLRASTDGLTWTTRSAGATAIPAIVYGSSQGICATAGSNAVAPQPAIIGLWRTNLTTLN
jgi:hypothetical protein